MNPVQATSSKRDLACGLQVLIAFWVAAALVACDPSGVIPSPGHGFDGLGPMTDLGHPGTDLQERVPRVPDSLDGAAAPNAPSDVVTELLLDLEGVTLNNGVSEPLSIHVPPDTLSLELVVMGTDGRVYWLSSWLTPDGDELFTPQWQPSESMICVSCLNPILAEEAVFAALIPNNPAVVTVVSGEHNVVVRGGALDDDLEGEISESVDVRVFVKRGAEVPEQGTLGLNLHFTGARGWSATSASEDPEFLAIVEEVAAIYGQVGVSLGEVTFRDVDPIYRVIEGYETGTAPLKELFGKCSSNSTEPQWQVALW